MKTEHKKENQLESLRQIMRDGVRDGWIEDDRTGSDAHPRASHSEQTGNSRVEFRRFDSHIAIEPYKLTRQTAEEIQAKLNDLAQYEGTHADFDIHDPNGEVAAVYLFQKGGKLYARGGRNTQVLRNPENLWQFLQRNKRIYNITFITDRRLAVEASHDSTTQTLTEKQ